jgi:hypothetical protein
MTDLKEHGLGPEPGETIPPLGQVVAEVLDRLEEGDLPTGLNFPMRRGSARGILEVRPDPDEPHSDLFVIRLAIMKVPTTDPAPLFRKLLELNKVLGGRAAFAIGKSDIIWLFAGRPTEGMDPEEVVDLILWTADQADELDDQLLDEFGREWEL